MTINDNELEISDEGNWLWLTEESAECHDEYISSDLSVIVLTSSSVCCSERTKVVLIDNWDRWMLQIWGFRDRVDFLDWQRAQSCGQDFTKEQQAKLKGLWSDFLLWHTRALWPYLSDSKNFINFSLLRKWTSAGLPALKKNSIFHKKETGTSDSSHTPR